LWQVLGAGPRRRRAYLRARRLLEAGSWEEALALAQAEWRGAPPAWQQKLQKLVGECHQDAADALLKQRAFEEALEPALEAAPLLGLDEAKERTRVVENALAEVRRVFAAGPEHTGAVEALIKRTFALCRPGPQQTGTPCPEASLWRALCQ